MATPPGGVGQDDQIKHIAVRLDRIRHTIARFQVVEKSLSKELIGLTCVGRSFITNKRGMPVMKLNHIHYEETKVAAYVRRAYDSITVDRL